MSKNINRFISSFSVTCFTFTYLCLFFSVHITHMCITSWEPLLFSLEEIFFFLWFIMHSYFVFIASVGPKVIFNLFFISVWKSYAVFSFVTLIQFPKMSEPTIFQSSTHIIHPFYALMSHLHDLFVGPVPVCLTHGHPLLSTAPGAAASRIRERAWYQAFPSNSGGCGGSGLEEWSHSLLVPGETQVSLRMPTSLWSTEFCSYFLCNYYLEPFHLEIPKLF